MILALFGAPGSGKGTLSGLLVEGSGFIHISTGDLLRDAIKNKTKLGIDAKLFMDRGELVDDRVVLSLVNEKLVSENDRGSTVNFVLDGFPRNSKQAFMLDSEFNRLGLKLDAAVFIDASDEIIINRLTGRLVCVTCGATYHISSRPSSMAGKCDRCKGELSTRSDDREDVIRKRLEIYNMSSSDLRNYYSERTKVIDIDGSLAPDLIFAQVRERLGF